LRPPRKLLTELSAIVINDLHSKSLGLLLQVTPNATHSQNSQSLTLGIVTKGWPASPLAFSKRVHASIEVSKRTENKEHVHIGRSVIHCGGDVRDEERGVTSTAGVDIYLVVASAYWRHVSIVPSQYMTMYQGTDIPQEAIYLREFGNASTNSWSI
jgi:hypothetical protein